MSGRKCPQKRPIWRRIGDVRFAETGWWCVQSDSNGSPVGNSLLTGKLTGNFAILGPQKPISLHETTVLQRLFTQFPTQIYRENILKNREFLSGNREFQLQGAQASISPTLVLRIAIVDPTASEWRGY